MKDGPSTDCVRRLLSCLREWAPGFSGRTSKYRRPNLRPFAQTRRERTPGYRLSLVRLRKARKNGLAPWGLCDRQICVLSLKLDWPKGDQTMQKYSALARRQSIPQSEPLDESQVRNNAGGFVYALSEWGRLERFLILGSDSN